MTTLDLGGEKVFQRYYADRGSGSQTGGILLSTSVDNIIPYRSPEAEKLPAWSPASTRICRSPVMVYNKLSLPENKWRAG